MASHRPSRFLPNVNLWQVRFGVLMSILVTIGGIAWGMRAVGNLRAESQSTAFLTFVVGIVLGVVLGTTYAVTAAAQHGSFFVDTPEEYARNRRGQMGRWSTLALGLAAVAATALLAAHLDFIVGGALCGVMLAWTPLVVAGWIRLERRRRATGR